MEATAVKEPTTLKIVRDPKVYLVGRQSVDLEAIETFLGDHGVSWQTDTEIGGEELAEMAGRVCYMSYGKGRKTNREFIGHLVEVGHGSVLEHAVWSFLVTGVSRSFTHELVRHRHFSYSQLSQRYVNESDSDFIEPDVIAAGPRAARGVARRGGRGAAGVRQAGRGAAEALCRHARGHAAPQDGAPGGALRAAQRHRDQDLRDRERAGAAAFHRDARQRARRRRDPQGGGGDAEDPAERSRPACSATTGSRRWPTARSSRGRITRRCNVGQTAMTLVTHRPVVRYDGGARTDVTDALAVEASARDPDRRPAPCR